MSNKLPAKWVLASASKHRQRQLAQAGHQVDIVPSEIDETPKPGEGPQDRASRLARAKAETVAAQHPGRLVIGSDQVAHLDGQLLRKPGELAQAVTQLMRSQGQTVNFETALHLCIWDQAEYSETLTTKIEFHHFDEHTARRYLALEPALDAAGSFYSEAIGQWLIRAHRSEDPSAIIGLPMLALGRGLRALGLDPLPANTNGSESTD